ncbi:Chitooligosaccharide deacetylase ChbG [Sporomusa rhizae]|uniref:ChbG/HpnK family deacetylase n=1 Tax=Sporomusa rhizae TaxID=357999 RepID=UPI00352AB8E1
MKQLIVNADDFGLHENINLGIVEGHVNGCITSTSLMAGAPAFEHAVSLAAKQPKLGIGVHLTLVGGRPVCDPGKIASLIDNKGMFPQSYPVFLKKACSGGISLSDVRRELTAQVQKVVAAGINVTHLDSHQHMHIVPGIVDVVIDIATTFGIRSMRIPAEPLMFFGGFKPSVGRILGRSGLSVLAKAAGFKAKRAGIIIPDHFFGMLAGGNMEEQLFVEIIDNLPEGISEIMIHPGLEEESLNKLFDWGYHWQQELAAVTSQRTTECLVQRRVKLVSFEDITNQ